MRHTRGQSLAEYLIIVVAVLGVLMALQDALQKKVGTNGEPGSIMQQVRAQF